MKKLLIMMTALMAVAVFSATSFAADTVQMTLTSPVIYKAGCEKIGSTTYAFDQGSVITAGDWWYMDLPQEVTLCKSYNYVILGKTGGNPRLDIDFDDINPSGNYAINATFLGGNIGNLALGGNGSPVYTSGVVGNVVNAGGNIAFLVRGTANQRRILIYAIGETPNGAATLTVQPDSQLNISLFDGRAHNDLTSTNPGQNAIALDRDGDGIYGELAGATPASINTLEVIGGAYFATGGEPYVENTLCANGENLVGQYMFTSYASKSDKFTFTGDSQIAHTGSAATIALASCKGDTEDNIEMAGLQDTCSFEYDTAGANGDYCTSSFKNKLLIEASSGAFGDIGDKYYLALEITSPSSGVYFNAAPTVVGYRSSEDECGDYVPTLGTALSANFDHYNGSTLLTSFASGQNDCAVASASQSDYVLQNNTMTLDDYDTIWVNMPSFNYTSAAVEAGEVVTVEVTLNRYPCGEIFSDTLDLGSFVTECAGASSTTLYFPWLPGTGATGWWGGFVITNVGDTSGVANLTYSDSTGATATLTTDSVAAGAQWVNSDVTADDLTDVSGFDMSLNHSVTAACGFQARGFAFTGNGNEGTGYLADQ